MGEDEGTEDLRFSTLKQHHRRFIGDGFSNTIPTHLTGYKLLDKAARKEQRKKHFIEMQKLKEEKLQEKLLVKQALDESMGTGMKDMFLSLQKMGGKAVG